MSGVYIIKFIGCNKVYIGETIDFKARWQNHSSLLKNNKHSNKKLQNAYNLYGEENICFEVLECIEPSKMTEKQYNYIELYDSFSNGFNNCTIEEECFINSNTEYIYQYSEKTGDFLNKFLNCTQASNITGINKKYIKKVLEEKLYSIEGSIFSKEIFNKNQILTRNIKNVLKPEIKKKITLIDETKICSLYIKGNSKEQIEEKLGYNKDTISMVLYKNKDKIIKNINSTCFN